MTRKLTPVASDFELCSAKDLIVNPVTQEHYINRKTGNPATLLGVPQKLGHLIESPKEAQFIRAVVKYCPELIDRITAQMKISVGDRNFRADFAIEDSMLIMEVDGWQYHDAAQDAERDSILADAGWKTIRVLHPGIACYMRRSLILINRHIENEGFLKRNRVDEDAKEIALKVFKVSEREASKLRRVIPSPSHYSEKEKVSKEPLSVDPFQRITDLWIKGAVSNRPHSSIRGKIDMPTVKD